MILTSLIFMNDYRMQFYSVFFPAFSLALALTLCSQHIQRGPPLCICLVFGIQYIALDTGI